VIRVHDVGVSDLETLLLLHGFTQTGRSWDEVIASLPPERYRALAPDLRGHGAAAALRPVSFAACIDDLLALAPERFALGGYSMGGRLALALALAHPDRVSSLALISATAGIGDDGERARRRAADDRLAAEIERDGVERFALAWGSQPLFADQPEPVRRRAHADRLRNDAPGLAASLRGMGAGAMTSLWPRLGELRGPVLVMAGARDTGYVEIGRRLTTAIAGARLVIVPGAGHAVALEAPAAVAGAIAERADRAR
jgi:2-succinyl-6-hydroxy-2,4-cyclohexadiene-1-carboxylate synthase